MQQETVDVLVVMSMLPYAWALTLMKAHHEFIEDLFAEDLCPDAN